MKRMLVISVWFPPSRAVGAKRAMGLVERAPGFGWEPHVLTLPAACFVGGVDPRLLDGLPPHSTVERVPCWNMWNHTNTWPLKPAGVERMAAIALRGIAYGIQALCPIDAFFPWSIAATASGVRMVRELGIDLVWATGPPMSAMWLAHRVSRRTAVPYCVDFRDVALSVEGARRPRRLWDEWAFEDRILRDAAGITYLAPGHAPELTRRHACLGEKRLKLVYGSFAAEEYASCSAASFARPTILHGGVIYGGMRRVDGFLEALSKLREAARPAARDLRFLALCEAGVDMTTFTRSIERARLAAVAEAAPLLPRREFVSACLGSEILLVLVGHDTGSVMHAAAIPGKLYDYFAACRPILVVGPQGCEAGRMVEQLNRGIAVPDDEPAAIADAILSLRRGEGRRGQLDLSLDSVRHFEASTAFRELTSFLDEALAASGAAKQRPGIAAPRT